MCDWGVRCLGVSLMQGIAAYKGENLPSEAFFAPRLADHDRWASAGSQARTKSPRPFNTALVVALRSHAPVTAHVWAERGARPVAVVRQFRAWSSAAASHRSLASRRISSEVPMPPGRAGRCLASAGTGRIGIRQGRRRSRRKAQAVSSNARSAARVRVASSLTLAMMVLARPASSPAGARYSTLDRRAVGS